jgi:hypothetical protein
MIRMPCGLRARDEGGYVLVVVLIVLVAVSGIALAAFRSTEAEVRIAANQYIGTQAGYAAEAGAEKLMADLYEEMADGILTPAEVAGIGGSPPNIPKYTYTDYGATMDASGVLRSVTQGPLAGLQSISNDVRIRSSVEGPRNARATVELQVLAQAIPIFQFGVFYEYDLENCPGPDMEIGGRVHSNADLYLDGIGRQRYWDMITAAGDIHLHPKASTNCTSDGINNLVQMNDLSWTEMISDTHSFGGDDIPGTFPTAAEDKAFDDHSKANWDHRVQTRASGMEPLQLPIPEGIDPYALIEPCTGSEATSLAEAKFACNAGLTVRVQGGVLEVLDGSGATKTLQDINAIQFLPNKFYDDREQTSNSGDAATGNNDNSNRDVIEIRIDLLSAGFGEYGGGVIYVTADSALAGGGYAPAHERQYAVRVSGGWLLQEPLSITTNLPLYVLGDYNTAAGAWQPASFASDAFTVLSGAWSDAASGEGNTENPPIDTRVEAALLSGHTPTPFFGSPNGGGWLNNYPRFLENWGGTVTLIGSLVSLWYPRVATAPYYQPSNPSFYSAPVRDWRFDSRFLVLGNLPPATPVVGQVVKLGYTRKY